MKKNIKIYFTSDIHGYFYSTNYADKKTRMIGLFSCANQFQKDENTLVIDGGDILQGSAFSYYCQNKLHSSKTVAQIMNLCGYDYVTIGNHDFNYGKNYLEEYLNHLNAKCVCQNIRDKNGKHRYSYDIKTMGNGIKIGIVGIVTDYINIWEKKENINHISITDPFIEAKKALEELKGKVDITIGVYHGGFERNIKTGEILSSTSENIGYRICEELDFDILLTGHQHMSIEGQDLHGTYILQPKENGVEYQMLHITFEDGIQSIHSIIKKAGEIRDFLPYHTFYQLEQDVQNWLDNEVGTLSKPLLPEDKLKMAMEGSEIADFLNRIQLYYSKAQISVVSLANNVKGFEKHVTRRDIIATYPYPNTFIICEITGAQLKAAIERSAEYFYLNEKKIVEIADKFLQPKTEHYNYDFYQGIEYQINPEKEEGERVVLLQYQQNDITMEQTFTICINNYRASGTGGYPMYPECKRVKEINVEMVELILDYFEIHANETIQIPDKERICI